MVITKIVSGGQTGADRAALEWALSRGFPCGGWCPRGRLAEDGEIEGRYPLVETPSASYRQRTDWNTRDSDGTVVFTLTPELTEGSLTTILCASRNKRPWLHLSSELLSGDSERAARFLATFVERHQIRILNVAGPRVSKESRIGLWVISVLDALF
jgi:hypothetical protein